MKSFPAIQAPRRHVGDPRAILAASLLAAVPGCDADSFFGPGASNAGVYVPPPALYAVDANTSSLYTVDPVTGKEVFIGRLDPSGVAYSTPIAMAVRNEEIFVWNNSDSANGLTGVLLVVDKCTGVATPVNRSAGPQGQMGALAFVGDRLFGAALTDSGFRLCEIDTGTGVARPVSDQATPNLAGMDADSRGILYGIEIGPVGTGEGAPALGTLDIATGAFRALSSVPVGTRSLIGSMAFDPSGQLLVSARDDTGRYLLLTVVPETGQILKSVVLEEMPQGLGFAPVCGR